MIYVLFTCVGSYTLTSDSRKQTPSSNVAQGGVGKGSQFEILGVEDELRGSSETLRNSKNHVDAHTSTKHPVQVQDTVGKSWTYKDLVKGQFQPRRGERGITKVMAGEFPSYEELDNTAGLLFYSIEVSCSTEVDVRVEICLNNLTSRRNTI